MRAYIGVKDAGYIAEGDEGLYRGGGECKVHAERRRIFFKL